MSGAVARPSGRASRTLIVPAKEANRKATPSQRSGYCHGFLMRIWIDLANSPHVPFFRPLADEFISRNHEVVVTARDFAETVPLAEAAGFNPEVIGGHGGGKLSGKAGNLLGRAFELARWGRGRGLDLAV